MEEGPFRVIHAAGAPHELGRTHGELAAEAIAASLAFYEMALPATGQTTLAAVCDEASSRADRWRAEEPALFDELEGIADGAGRDLREILALNCRDTYMHRTPGAIRDAMDDGCTSFAAIRDDGGHVVSGQNWDYLEGIADTIVLLHLAPSGQPRQLVLVEAGQVGRQGANDAGIVLQANGLPSVERDTAALPPTFLRRRVLRSADLEVALTAAIGTPRVGRVNLLVSSRDGIVLDLELDRVTARWLEPDPDGVLVHANHFDAEIPTSIEQTYRPDPSSLIRRTRARRLLRRRVRAGLPVDVSALQEVSRDHAGGAGGICQHARDVVPMDRWVTVASTITDLTAGVMWVAKGPPCEHAYVPFAIATGEPIAGDGAAPVPAPAELAR